MHGTRSYITLVCGLILTLCATTLRAQSDEALYAELGQNFKGELKEHGEVANARTQLWQKWTEAMSRRKSALKLDLCSFDSLKAYILPLPETLEPQAKMPYLWIDKGGTKTARRGSVPTYIYLHGSGPKDHEWKATVAWAHAFEGTPSRYFIPQIPHEGKYYRWWQKSKQWAYKQLWRALVVDSLTDADRVMLLGVSEGGYGSQRLASFYADYLAAAGPMAGGEPLINAPAENLGHVAFSLLTGEKDAMFCRNYFTALTGQALDSLATQYPDEYVHRVAFVPGAGHGFDYRPTAPWLFKHKRQSHPHHFVWEDYAMDGCFRRGFYNLKIDRRPVESDTLRTRYEVSIATDGLIDITICGVHYEALEKEPQWGIPIKYDKTTYPISGGQLTIFLDENLVDLNKKVTVRLNGKRVWRGKLRLRREHLFESLRTFEDPKRLYPAAVTINY